MSREDAQMKIRLPAELKAGIDEAASANKRTLNAEIVARLQASFDAPAALAVRPDAYIISRLLDEQLRSRLQEVRSRAAFYKFEADGLDYEIKELERQQPTPENGKAAIAERLALLRRKRKSLSAMIDPLLAEGERIDQQLESGQNL
ncbi:hypothetical protein J2W27_000341 [Variovorax boronicumulans]|uniref:Arc family DNA-binding protein n=1 Tax=Variovorax boronicumulans TaxID=436515 RepID=UPI00277E24EF|nr:Arc family DNA-binding protein [Variovorax boronicumulans]MDP9908248.1 hypothetical protein [Variovorax boronicumulans]